MTVLDFPAAAVYPFHEPTTTLRNWLRLVKIGGEPVFPDVGIFAGGLPVSQEMPAIAITRVGGGLNEPIDEGLFQFDVWGSTAGSRDDVRNRLVQVLVSAPVGLIRVGAITVDFTILDDGPMPTAAAPGVPWLGSPSVWAIIDSGGQHRASFVGPGDFNPLRLGIPVCADNNRVVRTQAYRTGNVAAGSVANQAIGELVFITAGGGWPATAQVNNSVGALGTVTLQPFVDGLQDFEWIISPTGDVTLIQHAATDSTLGTFSTLLGSDELEAITQNGAGEYTLFVAGCRDGAVRFSGATVVSDLPVSDPDPSIQHRAVTAQVVTVFSPPS